MNWVEFWKFLGCVWGAFLFAGGVTAAVMTWGPWVFVSLLIVGPLAAAIHIGRTS